MKIRAGYDIAFAVPQPTPIILMLKVHPTRANDLLTPDDFMIVPSVEWREYQDVFGNICTRILAAAGSMTFRTNFYIQHSGLPATASDRRAPRRRSRFFAG
jgi:hypothetical protein